MLALGKPPSPTYKYDLVGPCGEKLESLDRAVHAVLRSQMPQVVGNVTSENLMANGDS